MIPQLFSIGPLPINSFGLMVALSLLVGLHILANSFRKSGIDPALAEVFTLTAGVVGLIAARLWYIGEHFSELKQDLFGALVAGAGFTFYGGFLFTFIALYILAKRKQVKWSALLDASGPALAIGYCIGRLGCQLSGDGDYGMSSTSWWAMSYESGVVPTPPGVLALVTPLFESFMVGIVTIVLLHVEGKQAWREVPYARTTLTLGLLAIERFIIEFWRVNPKVTEVLSQAQVISLGLIGVCALLLFKVMRGRALIVSSQ